MNFKNILVSKREQTKGYIYTVRFHLDEVQEHLKLICGDRDKNSGWRWGGVDWKGA